MTSDPLEEKNENDNENFEEQQFERPIECSECKRSIAVHYTEIVGKEISHVYMCNECPILRHRLHGMPHIERFGQHTNGETGLACGNCGTTLDAVRLGTPLGCNVCYEVFDAIILPEMQAAHKVPSRLVNGKKSVHRGRSPGEIQEISPSLRLLALNEALNEMLKTEDYEQAALLRDQIIALTKKKPESSDHEK